MRNLPNIEKSGFAGRQYVGYDASGRSWSITGQSGYWSAKASVTKQGSTNLLIGFETLAQISHELAQTGNEAS